MDVDNEYHCRELAERGSEGLKSCCPRAIPDLERYNSAGTIGRTSVTFDIQKLITSNGALECVLGYARSHLEIE